MPVLDVSIFYFFSNLSILCDDSDEIVNILFYMLHSEHIKIEQTRKSTNGRGYDMSYGSDGPITR